MAKQNFIPLLAGLILLFSFFIVSAEMETYIVGKENNLQFTCTLDGAIPSSGNFNISIYSPNGTRLLNNQPTTSQGSGSFNYSYIFNEIGIYKIKMFCSDGTNSFSDEGFYNINPTGKELTIAKSIAYGGIVIISILIFGGLLYMGLSLPSGNKRDEMSGYILAVSNLKYLKYLFLCLSYLMALVIVYFFYEFSYSYLDLQVMTTILNFIFKTMLVLIVPLFILFVYLCIANIIRDNEIGDYLMRGLRIK
jgi:hypothetical protein